MSAAAPKQSPDTDMPPYRLRKPSRFFPTSTLSDLQKIVEDSGQRELVVRMAHAARRLEAAGERCDTLAELKAAVHLAPAPNALAGTLEAELQSLLKDVVGRAVKLGESSQDAAARAFYFALCHDCQRAASEIGRRRLWSEAR